MGNENTRKTGAPPWSYREGTMVASAILLLGFFLQVAGGGVVLRIAGFPWNLVAGMVFLALLILTFFRWQKHAIIKGLGSVKAALPAIVGFTFLVLLMGFVKQDVEPKNALSKLFGLNHLVKTWPFILINLYLMILLGVATLKRLSPFTLKNFGFFLNHFGLFLVLFSTAFGSADIRTATMDCYKNKEENRGAGENGTLTELPLSIKLLNFSIENFPPKVAVIDNTSGEIVKENGREKFGSLDQKAFDLFQYHLEVDTFYAYSAKTEKSYFVSDEPGSSPAARIKVTGLNDHSVTDGWICSGSYMMQTIALKLNNNHSLIMLPAEPKKFSSEVSVSTNDGKSQTAVIEVNRPFRINGWTIYQLGYDKELGRWSELSVLQLVRDPWLPAVYTGIFLMMAGAIFLFIYGNPKSGGDRHVA